jgi:sugar lactone lactonase YvrE
MAENAISMSKKDREYGVRSLGMVLMLALALCCGCAGPKKQDRPLVVYPEPPDRPRLQFLVSISSEEDLQEPGNAFRDYLLGPDLLRFSDIGRPYDVGASAGKIYLVDRKIKAVMAINLQSGKFDILGDMGEGQLRDPAGLWVDNEGRIYVADMLRRQVVIFGPDQRFERAVGGPDSFEKPVDVVTHEGRLYVCDIKQHQILVLDLASEQLVDRVGTIGSDEGKLYKPTHIAIRDDGYLYVNDAFNFRVQKYSPDGAFAGTYGFHSDRIGGMVRSKGVAVDRQNHLYVADAAFERVQIFDDEARLLMFFGGPGIQPGDMYLPAGIHIDYANVDYFRKFADSRMDLRYLVYVCNMSGPNRLNVYGFGDWHGE